MRYIPNNTTETIETLGLVIHLYQDRHCSAIAWSGKRTNPDFNIRFLTEARRREHVDQYIEGRRKTLEAKQEAKLAQAAPHTIDVGTIVYNTWGWEQTNIDFYVVTRRSARFVWLRPVKATTTETGSMCGHKAPLEPTQVVENYGETQRKVSRWRGDVTINFGHGVGYVYDGTPKSCSWYG